MHARNNIIDARGGMSYLSQVTHLSRETLYRTLSEDGNPRLDTLRKILGAMGLRVSVAVQQPEACTQ